jgi:DHA1 family multidrug resistance protein-like MFS transporter
MSKQASHYKLWKRNLYVIALAELVAIIGFSVASPILPLYVRDLGVVDEQAVRIWSGVIFSIQAVTMAIFGPIWGAVSDRHGRKLMVERAMFSGSVLMALMGFAQSVHQLALLRALQGALTGTVTAANALVATTAPKERVGYAVGVLQMAVYIGASMGPMVGGFVSDTFGYRAAFWVTGGLLFLSAMGVLLFVTEEFDPSSNDAEGSEDATGDLTLRRRISNQMAPILGSSALLSLMGVNMISRLGTRFLLPVLPLFVETIAAEGARVASLSGLVSGVRAGAGAVGALFLGRLGDRIGYRKVLIGCAAVATLFYTPQYFVQKPITLLILQGGAGLAIGGILAAMSASLATLAPEGQEGIVYGVDASISSAASALGPMTGSALAYWLGLRAPFLVAGLVFVLSGIITLWLMPEPSEVVQ